VQRLERKLVHRKPLAMEARNIRLFPKHIYFKTGELSFMRIKGLFLEDFRESNDNQNNNKNKRPKKKQEIPDVKKEKVKKFSQKPY